jgi:hypothetical protein
MARRKAKKVFKMVKVASLIIDDRLYPRVHQNDFLVSKYARDMRDGDVFPAIIIDEKTLKIADGTTRARAALRVQGEGAELMAELRSFKNDEEIFQLTWDINKRHGRSLSGVDRAHCAFIARDVLGMDAEKVAEFLGSPIDRIREYFMTSMTDDVGNQVAPHPGSTPPILHGKQLTRGQSDVNRRADGCGQSRHVSLVSGMLRNNMIDLQSRDTMVSLVNLRIELEKFMSRNDVKKAVKAALSATPLAPAKKRPKKGK